MALRVTTLRVEPEIVVLHLGGSIAISPETDALEWLLYDLLRQGERRLIFDLADIDQIDADAALFVVRCFFAVRGSGGELRFAAADQVWPSPLRGRCSIPYFLSIRRSLLPANISLAVPRAAADQPDTGLVGSFPSNLFHRSEGCVVGLRLEPPGVELDTVYVWIFGTLFAVSEGYASELLVRDMVGRAQWKMLLDVSSLDKIDSATAHFVTQRFPRYGRQKGGFVWLAPPT